MQIKNKTHSSNLPLLFLSPFLLLVHSKNNQSTIMADWISISTKIFQINSTKKKKNEITPPATTKRIEKEKTRRHSTTEKEKREKLKWKFRKIWNHAWEYYNTRGQIRFRFRFHFHVWLCCSKCSNKIMAGGMLEWKDNNTLLALSFTCHTRVESALTFMLHSSTEQ